jgi:hypothetical protein
LKSPGFAGIQCALMDITNLSPRQLRQAADLKEKIDGLQDQLIEILGGEVSTPMASGPAAEPGRKKRKMTAAWRKALSLAQKARWAKVKGARNGTQPTPKPESKPKRYISPALRRARSVAMKTRWAKARRAGKSRP